MTTTGDGIITALQVLSSLRRSGRSLHDLKKMMSKRPQVLINIRAHTQFNLQDYPDIQHIVMKVEQSLAQRGRVLLRASGTEPLVRVMVEADDAQTAQSAAESIAAVVRALVSGSKN